MEVYYTEKLLDPFEKEFDLPAVSIKFGGSQSRQREVVCEEDQGILGLCIEVFDSPKFLWIALGGTRVNKTDDLIAFDSRCLVDGVGVKPSGLEVGLGEAVRCFRTRSIPAIRQ